MKIWLYKKIFFPKSHSTLVWKYFGAVLPFTALLRVATLLQYE